MRLVLPPWPFLNCRLSLNCHWLYTKCLINKNRQIYILTKGVLLGKVQTKTNGTYVVTDSTYLIKPDTMLILAY